MASERRGRSIGRSAAALAALVGVAVLGNMRPAVSETPTSWHAIAMISGDAAESVLHDRFLVEANGDPEDVPLEATESRTDGRFVPAIFARNPEARIVDFRHVRKWM